MALAAQSLDQTTKRRKINDQAQQEAELRDLVRQCAESGDLEESVAAVLERLDEIPHLNALFRQQAAQELVYRARENLRAQMERQSAWTIPERAARMSDARLNARISLYDWPLPGSDVRLGDATVEDLQAAAQYHEERAAGEQRRAAIYEQVAVMLKEARKDRVRDGVSEDKLAEVMRGAQ